MSTPACFRMLPIVPGATSRCRGTTAVLGDPTFCLGELDVASPLPNQRETRSAQLPHHLTVRIRLHLCRRRCGDRILEVQFQRLAEIRKRLRACSALTCYLYPASTGDEPLAVTPDIRLGLILGVAVPSRHASQVPAASVNHRDSALLDRMASTHQRCASPLLIPRLENSAPPHRRAPRGGWIPDQGGYQELTHTRVGRGYPSGSLDGVWSDKL